MHATSNPHAGERVHHGGVPPQHARLAVVLVHGRGGSAAEMLQFADEFGTFDVAYFAPQAAGHSWYPYSFLAPIEQNEPGITSGLDVLGTLAGNLERAGVGADRLVLLGFSQGACLALEFAARHPRRYAGIVGLSGALIGPATAPRDDHGALDGTPVLLGCSDDDPHIPLDRVRESAEVFRRMGGTVEERIYRGMGHTINEDELTAIRTLLARGVNVPDTSSRR